MKIVNCYGTFYFFNEETGLMYKDNMTADLASRYLACHLKDDMTWTSYVSVGMPLIEYLVYNESMNIIMLLDPYQHITVRFLENMEKESRRRVNLLLNT